VVRKKLMRGDKLKDIVLYVYMHNKFSKDKINVSDLKRIVDYSAGGVYSAFESRYLEKIGDEIRLTEEGLEYVKERILPEYNVYKSYGNILLLLGFFFLFEWAEWYLLKTQIEPTWYFAAMLVTLGLFLRYLVLRFNFFVTNRRKRMEA
jgi:hypothetical protein